VFFPIRFDSQLKNHTTLHVAKQTHMKMFPKTLALFFLTSPTFLLTNARTINTIAPPTPQIHDNPISVDSSRPLHWNRGLFDIPAPQRADGGNGYIGGIYMCTDYWLNGTCSYAKYEPSTCYNLDAPFLNNVSSFSPDQYAGDEIFKFRCRIWDAEGCSGRNVSLSWPGSLNLTVDDPTIDKNGKSVKCDFDQQEGAQLYKEWKSQGYDFDKGVQRGPKCESFCSSTKT
jgi:hypothetical protein